MPNERLWSAMAAPRVDVESLSKAAAVNIKPPLGDRLRRAERQIELLAYAMPSTRFHLRQLGGHDSMFSSFVNQFEVIWARTTPADRPAGESPARRPTPGAR